MTLIDGPGLLPAEKDPEWLKLTERLFALARKGMVLGLERLEPVLERLGHPEKNIPYIHVAGTNGKGSTCAFLASILSHAGYRVGVYTSPHIHDLTERVTWYQDGQGENVSREEMHDAIRRLEEICPDFEPLTFFEVITVVALMLITDKQPDYAIVEAGLGARLDATRMVDAQLSILCDISLDHCAYLGDTIDEIAQEKLAVIRPTKPLVAAPDLKAVENAARENSSTLFRIGDQMSAEFVDREGWSFRLGARRIHHLELGLAGEHQARNALLATQAALLLDPELTEDQIRLGLLNTRWPGRLEWGNTQDGIRCLFDAAHNPAGAEMLSQYIKGKSDRPWHFVFGGMADKDLTGVLRPLLPVATTWTLTQGWSPRFCQASEIKEIFRREGWGPADCFQGSEDAFAHASALARQDGGSVVICGSIFLIGELRGKLAGHSRPVLP